MNKLENRLSKLEKGDGKERFIVIIVKQGQTDEVAAKEAGHDLEALRQEEAQGKPLTIVFIKRW